VTTQTPRDHTKKMAGRGKGGKGMHKGSTAKRIKQVKDKEEEEEEEKDDEQQEEEEESEDDDEEEEEEEEESEDEDKEEEGEVSKILNYKEDEVKTSLPEMVVLIDESTIVPVNPTVVVDLVAEDVVVTGSSDVKATQLLVYYLVVQEEE